MKVLNFDAQWSSTTLPGNGGATIVTPPACRTESHPAAAGEVAVIALSGTGAPAQASTDFLYINSMVSVNGSAFAKKNIATAGESTSDGTAHASINMRYPLEAGKTYVFGAGFASNSSMTVSPGYCQGVDDRPLLNGCRGAPGDAGTRGSAANACAFVARISHRV